MSEDVIDQSGRLKRLNDETYTPVENAGSHRGQVVQVQSKSGKAMALQAYQLPNLHGMMVSKILNVITSIDPTIFTQTGFVEVRLSKDGIVNMAQSLYVDLTLRNSHGSLPIDLPPTWVLIDRIEFLKEDGTNELMEQRGISEYWLSQLKFNLEELETLSHDLNHDINGNNPWPLASGETRILSLPLFNSLHNVARFHHKGHGADMILRFHMRVNPLRSVSGSFAPTANLILDRLAIRYRQVNQLKQHNDRNTQMVRSGVGLSYRYYQWERHIERQTLAADTQVTFTLDGFRGYAAFLMAYWIQNDSPLVAATGNFITPSEMSVIDFTDHAEQTLLGGQPEASRTLRFVYRQSMGFPGQLLQKKFVYIVPFASDPAAAIATGANYGGFIFQGGGDAPKIKVTTPPAFPAAAAAGYQTAALAAPLEERDEYNWTTAAAGEIADGGTFQVGFMGKTTPPLGFDTTVAALETELNRSFADTGLVFDVAAPGGSGAGNAGFDNASGTGGFAIQISNFGANHRQVPSRQGKCLHLIDHMDDGGAKLFPLITQPRTGRVGLQGHVAGGYTGTFWAPMMHEFKSAGGSVVKHKVV